MTTRVAYSVGMTRSIPTAPADDLFSDDFMSPMDIAVTEARRNNGRKVVVEAAPVVEIEAPVVHRCTRCHRVLTSAASVERGTGPVCETKIRAALTLIGETFSPRQIVAATELIADGGVVVGPHGTCLAVSSRGDEVYAVNPHAGTCTCKAGQYGRLCYHVCASLALTI